MKRYDRRVWLFATALAALAGFVDAIGFIQLGGFFVSFMSGNSTRLGVGLASEGAAAALAAILLVAFVGGVMAGTAIAHAAVARRGMAVLGLVAALLLTAALVGDTDARFAALLMAAAMGAENAVFARNGEVSIGVTYMTGALVKLGQNATIALLGGPRWDWIPYLLLWSGLVSGAVAGAATHGALGLDALWPAAAVAATLALVAGARRFAP